MNVKCKFICSESTFYIGGFSVKFSPVNSGSEENRKFWKATPSGSLVLNTINEMPFKVGKEYYLDISEV